jgi:hypothetical protein
MRFGLVLRSSPLLSLSVMLTGCALTPTATTVPDPNAPTALHGQALGGQQPIANALVYLYQAGTTGYGQGSELLASATTNSQGSFQFTAQYQCPTSNPPVYLLVSGGSPGLPNQLPNGSIVLAAGLGSCSASKTENVSINEVTTAVTAFALSHYFTTTLGGEVFSDSFGSTTANTPSLALSNSSTIQTLVNLATGTVKPKTAQTTIESAKINSVANTLAACVNSYGGSTNNSPCATLFADTTPPGSTTAPTDTLQAAVQMALYPNQNVAALYKLASATPPFVGLSSAPGDWTIGVSYKTANFALSVNGTATTTTSTNIDVDASGRVWFPSNGPGLAGVAYFDPASQTFNGPYLTSLFHPQYLAISGQGTLYATDMSENYLAYMPVSAPTTTTYVYDTAGESGPLAIANNGDPDDTVIFVAGATSSASTGSEAYALRPDKSQITDLGPYSQPVQAQAVEIMDNGLAEAGASSSNGNLCAQEQPAPIGILLQSDGPNCISGGLVQFGAGDGISTIIYPADQTYNGSQVCILDQDACGPFTPQLLYGPKGIAEDGDGQFWVANEQNGSVSLFFYVPAYDTYTTDTQVAFLHNSQNGATMITPFAIALDGSGNVWVANAGCISTSIYGCTPGPFVLSELIGAGAPTVMPLAAQNQSFPAHAGTRPGLPPPNPYLRKANGKMATTILRHAPAQGLPAQPHLIQKQ